MKIEEHEKACKEHGSIARGQNIGAVKIGKGSLLVPAENVKNLNNISRGKKLQ